MKNNKGLFRSLLKNYIIFIISIVVVMIIISIYTQLDLGKKMSEGDFPKIFASDIEIDEINNSKIEELLSMDGWCEILDSEFNVIKIYGEKKDKEYRYNPRELVEQLSVKLKIKQKYFITMKGFTEGEIQKYLLVKIPFKYINEKITFNNPPYKIGRTFYETIMKAAVLFIVLFILNIMIFAFWSMKKIKKPLDKITLGIKKMSGGDYSTRLQFEGEKEFIIIRDTFNFMAESIENSTREKIEEEEKKMMMISAISHDIKTPLTSINGFSRALSEGIVNDEKKQKYYEAILKKSNIVDQLLNDMMDFAKLNNSTYKLEMKGSDFGEFIREIITDYYDEMEEKKFEVEINIPEEEIIKKFDRKLFHRAISNIVSNMIKYNDENAKLLFEVRFIQGEIILEISDNGNGIPEEDREKIFEPFVRGDNTRKSDGGSGLGLSICRSIIERHDGSIEIHQGLENRGIKYHIELNIDNTGTDNPGTVH